MKHVASALAAAVLLGHVPATQAAGFNCAKARSQVEKMVCADPQLSSLDDQLVAAYNAAVTVNSDVPDMEKQWLRDVRDVCQDVACLNTAYRQQIQRLQQIASSDHAEPAQATPKNNPLSVLLEAKSFIGNPSLREESTWRDPERELFGKKVMDWTEADFALLQQKLSEQIAAERTQAAQYMQERGLSGSPDQDSIYLTRKGELVQAIQALPKMQYWAQMAREEHQQRATAQQAQLAQEQAAASAAQEQEHLAQQQAEVELVAAKAKQQSDLIKWGVIAVILAGLAGWVWHVFFRNRCPKCKSTSFATVNAEELDRWRGTKQVTERNTKGSKTRHVQTTFVKMLYEYECNHCQHHWVIEKKQEL